MAALWFSKQGAAESFSQGWRVPMGPIAIRMFWVLLKEAVHAGQHVLLGMVQVGSQRVPASYPTVTLRLALSVASLRFLVCQVSILPLTWQGSMRTAPSPALVKMRLLLLYMSGPL